MDLRDASGEIEIVCLLEELGAEPPELLSCIDVGDIVGIDGTLVTTRRGEAALEATGVTILGKSLALPPKRELGEAQDPRQYSRPEAALIAGEEMHRVLRLRVDLMSLIRTYLGNRDFLEVETPMLLPLASGATARPFVTRSNVLDSDLYLRIATEQHLKRWLIGGFERVFEVARCFRNEGLSNRHHFEFTMLEWMEGYADFNASMDLIEDLTRFCAVSLNGTSKVQRGNEAIDLSRPWRRISVREAILEAVGTDIMSADRSRLALLFGDESDPEMPWPELIGAVYSKLVEPRLLEPTFVTDFPRELFPLAKTANDCFAAEAFEAVVGGIEIATGVTSISDVDEQRSRFAEQRARRDSRLPDREETGLDEDFLKALAYGMMPATCAGIGIDRVLMLLAGTAAIRDVIPFPTR